MNWTKLLKLLIINIESNGFIQKVHIVAFFLILNKSIKKN